MNLRAESGTRTRDLLITNELLYQLSYFGLLLFSEKRCKDTAFFGPTKDFDHFFSRIYLIGIRKRMLMHLSALANAPKCEARCT